MNLCQKNQRYMTDVGPYMQYNNIMYSYISFFANKMNNFPTVICNPWCYSVMLIHAYYMITSPYNTDTKSHMLPLLGGLACLGVKIRTLFIHMWYAHCKRSNAAFEKHDALV